MRVKIAASRILLGLSLALGLAACGGEPEACRPDPAASAPPAKLHLDHLERLFFQLKTPAEAAQFMNAHPRFARFYLQRGQAAPDSALANALAKLATNPALQKLGRETAAAFPDSAALRRDLGALFTRVHYYFPNFRTPPAYTYVSGLLGKDVFVNDSLLVLSLDWFAGSKASFRPDLPNYILQRYTPAHVLPTLAAAVAAKYNRHELTANTVLDRMVTEGKRLYFASQMLPCVPDSLLMGYTGKELSNLEFNEGRVWAHFIEKNLLYSTTPFLVQKYVGERPNVPEIDRTCPGRVGQWVGLQIVRKYAAEHPKLTLAEIMAEKDAQRILNESHYRPQKRG